MNKYPVSFFVASFFIFLFFLEKMGRKYSILFGKLCILLSYVVFSASPLCYSSLLCSLIFHFLCSTHFCDILCRMKGTSIIDRENGNVDFYLRGNYFLKNFSCTGIVNVMIYSGRCIKMLSVYNYSQENLILHT